MREQNNQRMYAWISRLNDIGPGQEGTNVIDGAQDRHIAGLR